MVVVNPFAAFSKSVAKRERVLPRFGRMPARLVLLRHKFRRLFGWNLRAQQGHRGRMRASATISF